MSDGVAAVSACRAELPDLAVLDISDPNKPRYAAINPDVEVVGVPRLHDYLAGRQTQLLANDLRERGVRTRALLENRRVQDDVPVGVQFDTRRGLPLALAFVGEGYPPSDPCRLRRRESGPAPSRAPDWDWPA